MMIYPVFDSFDLKNRKVAGVISSSLYWQQYFMNILPDDMQGVICVLENTLGQIMTFRIDGAEVTYMGEGDLHVDEFDHMVQSEDVAEYLKARATIERRAYTVELIVIG